QLAMGIEKFSQHPIASAIIRHAQAKHIPSVEAENFDSITGKGAQANINGVTYYIGSPALFEGVYGKDVQTKEIARLQEEGNTVVRVGTQDTTIGTVAVADKVTEESSTMIDELEKLTITATLMLTGDNQATRHVIGRKPGSG